MRVRESEVETEDRRRGREEKERAGRASESWSPQFSLAAVLLIRRYRDRSCGWRWVLVVRWHRAVVRQGPGHSAYTANPPLVMPAGPDR